MRTPAFEYRTTFANVPSGFPDHEQIASQLSGISPKPPKGEDWQLASSTTLRNERGENIIMYFWERPAHARAIMG